MPEVVVIVGMLACTLAALAAWLILFGMRLTMVDWAVALLRFVADHTPSLPFFGNIAGNLATALEKTLGAVLAKAANACEGVMVAMLNGMEWIVIDTADSIAFLARETLHGIRVLRDSVVPGLIHDVTGPLNHELQRLQDLARTARESLQDVINLGESRVTALERTIERRVAERVAAAVAAGEGALIGSYAGSLGALKAIIGDTWATLRARIRRLEQVTGLAALAGLIAATVTLEWPWLRCTNIGRLGKAMCGFPVRLLEDLLAGLVDALTIVEICNIAQVVQALAREAEPVLAELILVENAVCLAGGASFPTGYVQPSRLQRATFASAI